jgi:geranylgeranyl diphosphate synthase type II
VTSFEDFLRESQQLVDEALERHVPTEEQAGPLAGAMRHIVFAGGKRLRPALAQLGCRHVGGQPADALGAALAVELVHAYSLLHDDLPCMDDASLRRGRPCAHKVFGEAVAVLAGDALLTLAFEVLVRETPPGRPLQAMVSALAEAAGWGGMVGGQVADLQAEGQVPELERVHAIHRGKTAAMISVSFRLGALAGGGSASAVERLSDAGRDFGLAFQIVDDLLDLQSTTEELGKPTGADAEHQKMTWPSAVGVEAAWADAAELVEGAVLRAGEGHEGGLIAALAEFLVARRP